MPPLNSTTQRPSVSHSGSYNNGGSSSMNSSHDLPLNLSTPGTPLPPRIEPRRRGSSFGFGTNFFSSLTNSLRTSVSSSNLNNGGSPSNRSRAGSSASRLNMVHNVNNSAPAINRAASSAAAIPIAHPSPSPVPESSNLDQLPPPSSSTDLYAATPTTDELFQGQTRSNSLMNTQRQKPDIDGTYSIRLTPFIDHSASQQGLYFSPLLRKIKPNSRISIGRYTDKVRDAAQAPPGSDAPVVFKSKVVSRIHAEFYVDNDGNWFIKDLKSSSGTFLNHVRLSPAGVESSNTPLQNGDVLQLGMDFRGGIEDIFRCVKMRVETNKSWQRKANQFNKEAHEKLKSLALLNDNELSECAICLLKVKPCQAVFISPCSHCWHYKCIRPIVVKSYPQFLCPNCRETCDLEADLDEDDSMDEMEEEEEEEDEQDEHIGIQEEMDEDVVLRQGSNDEILHRGTTIHKNSSHSTTDDEQIMMDALDDEST
ncbi:CYFA0S13e00496g1_1 [Cyberlindnera fabianii]|uniref:RING-type E3 ubiquitin transferase n=1 Tax=Cyberlindnera fabianii TaxID=36022 RepID=A0A061BAG3_CYBFA|nr:CYFA0S13e00496g1_1 [Cyberlindnera fabianii]